MKKYIFILAALCVSALVSCNKDDVTYENKSLIEIISSDANFPAIGGEGEVKFKLDASLSGTVEANSSKPWLTITETGDGTVSFTVSPSGAALARSADLTISVGEERQTVTILQSGVIFDFDSDNEILNLDPTGVSAKTLSYDTSGEPPTYKIQYTNVAEGQTLDWLQITIGDGKIEFYAGLNLENEFRTAVVTISQGWKSVTVYVVQPAASAVSFDNFGCDRQACISDDITLADYAVEFLQDWTIECDSDWFEVLEITEDSFKISVDENTTGVERKGGVKIKNAHGTVISTLPVRQTRFSFNELLGVYQFPYSEATWLWDFKADPDKGDAFLVKCQAGLTKSEKYKLKLDYVASGEDAPKLTLALPQDLGIVGGEARKLWAAVSSSQWGLYWPDECYYDLVYVEGTETITFDFVQSAKNAEGRIIQGLYLTSDDATENWIYPDSAHGCLYIQKWGIGNHDSFTE